MEWLPAFGIFNMHSDADACSCTKEMYKVCKESLQYNENWRGEKSLGALGNESNQYQYRPWLFSPAVY